MQTTRYKPTADWGVIASIVDRFEAARGHDPSTDLGDFLPTADAPHYRATASELIRVDLELKWNEGARRQLADYQNVAPRLFEDTAALGELAYEEYRLRRLAGEAVRPEDYSERFGVETGAWPLFQGDAEMSVGGGTVALPDDEEYPTAGDDFAGFKLSRVIGKGAFSRVYLAEQNDLAQRHVVLKLSRRRSLEPEHLARLQHTNIVPIYSVHEANGLIAVCMPYHGEQTMATLLDSCTRNAGSRSVGWVLADTIAVAEETLTGPRRAAEEVDCSAATNRRSVRSSVAVSSTKQVNAAVRVVREIALGLSHAHDRGIVHRDLKPANVLLADDGRPMLLDFNLSDAAAVDGAASLTVGGTLPYMAPEHLQAVMLDGEVDPRADIYSLGVVLFELLTGKRPFPNRTGELEDVLSKSQDDRADSPPSPRALTAATPPSIDALVKKCLAPRPMDRYQTAAELAEDLGRHLRDLPLRYGGNPSFTETIGKWRRRHPRVSTVVPVVALGTLLVALFAGLWVARASRVVQLESKQHFNSFQEDASIARLALSLPESDAVLLADGLATVDRIVAEYAPSDNDHERRNRLFAALPGSDQRAMKEQLAQLSFLQARAERILAGNPVDNDRARGRLERAFRYNTAAVGFLGGVSEALAAQRASLLASLGRTPVPATNLLPPGNLDDYHRVQQLLTEREFASARECLEALRTAYPSDPVVWLLLGNALGGLGKHDDAEAALTMAASLEPRSYVAIYNRGLSRMQREELRAAIADFDWVLKQRPELLCALLNRALAFEEAQEYSMALRDLDIVIDSGKAPSRAWLLRSRVRRRLGDKPGAEDDLRRGTALAPSDELGWVARGVARLRNDPEGALSDFRAALANNPRSVLALKNIVHVTADRIQRPGEARDALDAWLEIDPGNASALVGRAVLVARIGERKAALDDVAAALRESNEPVILFQAACVYSHTATEENDDFNRGLALLSAAADRDPRLLARASTDPDLRRLRETAGFKRLLDAYRELGQIKRSLITRPGSTPFPSPGSTVLQR